MSFITRDVREKLRESRVEVFFVSGAAKKWWNANRDLRRPGDIAVLGGWYWTYEGEEAGPFRTPSAAMRDVYYRHVLRELPPLMDKKDLAKVEREMAKHEKKELTKERPSANVVRLRRAAA